MLWSWIAGISLVGLAMYLWYMWLFSRGLRQDNEESANTRPFVSVIIAARNEEENLPHLLTALVNQSYPQTLYEVIIADDASTDHTAAVIERFQSKWSNIHSIAVTGRREAVSPKKNALTQAIHASHGEIVMLTDADCVVGKYWIESMLSYYRDDVAMVCGFSTPQTGPWKSASLVRKYEYFDIVAMFSAAAGAINSGKYFSCTGQNLSYRRAAWDAVGGFESIKHLVSGDDVNLMQLFRRAGKRIRFACNYHGFAVTQPISGWTGLFNQRSRWASNMKWQWNLNPEFYAYLVSVLIVTYLPWILLFWQPLIGAGILIVKWVAEFRFLHQAVERFKIEPQRLGFYPLWVLIQPWYMIIVAFGGALDGFRWKE